MTGHCENRCSTDFEVCGYLKIGEVKKLPKADSSYRGKLILVLGGVGVADGIYACLKQADESYAWVKIG